MRRFLPWMLLAAGLSIAACTRHDGKPPDASPPDSKGPTPASTLAEAAKPPAKSCGPAASAEAGAPADAAPAATASSIRIELFERVLELNKVLEPELDEVAARVAFKALAFAARDAIADSPSPYQTVGRLNRVLLTDRQVSYISRKYWRDSTLASSLLRKRGNCMSTSTLYFLVGDALSLPIKFVLMPEHAFVRWDDGKVRINIETVNGRIGFSDAEYEDRFSKSPREWRYYGFGKSGGNDELMLELLDNVADHLTGQSRQKEAIEYTNRAIGLSPGRHDLLLQRAQLRVAMTKKRDDFRREVFTIMRIPGLPPSMHATLLCTLADEYGAEGDHQKAREYLMQAFPIAPKYMQDGILTELAFCHRAMRDNRGGARYMELAAAFHTDDGDPSRAMYLYNLAVLQKTDGRLKDALASIDEGLECNPEAWGLKILKAGYTILDGRRPEGLELFEQIKDERPRAGAEFYNDMIAWFYAASQQREEFYAAFEHALAQAKTVSILHWIDQDVDLDVYRNEDEFQRLLGKHRARLLGKDGDERREKAATPPAEGADSEDTAAEELTTPAGP